MKTRALAIAALSLGLVHCLAGNNASVELARICSHPAPDTTTGACLYPATCDVGQLLNQQVDPTVSPGIGGAYLWTPIQVNNQLPNNEDLSVGRLNTNDAFIQEARLKYEIAGVTVLEITYSMGPQLVSAGGSAVLLFPIVPANVTLPPGLVMVTLKAAGQLSDTSTFVTAEYKIPVQVCTGCIAGVPPCCPQVGQTNTCG